jgi:hypothetical protein
VIFLLTTAYDSASQVGYRDTYQSPAYVDSDYISNSRVGFIENCLTSTAFGAYLTDGPHQPRSLKIGQGL